MKKLINYIEEDEDEYLTSEELFNKYYDDYTL